MVVADDEINALTIGIINLVVCFDTTVQGNDQAETIGFGIVDPLDRNTVAFTITVWYIIFHAGVKIPEETVHYRYGRRTIHVIIAIDQYLFLIPDSSFNAFYSLVHILH